MLAVRAARAARLPALDFAVFFFVFFDFVDFFAWPEEPVAALDFPAAALRGWPAEKANAIRAKSATASHRDARRGADEGEDETIPSLYSAFARSARSGESIAARRAEMEWLARAFPRRPTRRLFDTARRSPLHSHYRQHQAFPAESGKFRNQPT